MEQGVRHLERIRIQRHLSAVEADLRVTETPGLSSDSRARRAVNLDRLRGYWIAGRFPKNTRVPGRRTPVFVDPKGTPCAVASLMLQSGDRDLVERVVREDNHVRIRDIDAGPVLGWLDREGLTKEEAARIQPSYSPNLDFPIFATALFAVLLPLRIVAGAIWRRIPRTWERAGTWAALGLTTGVVFVAVGISVGAATLLQPTTEPYAAIYRRALVLAFLATLLPLELAALLALHRGEPHQAQRWPAIAPYLSLVNAGIATVLAFQFIPVFLTLLK